MGFIKADYFLGGLGGGIGGVGPLNYHDFCWKEKFGRNHEEKHLEELKLQVLFFFNLLLYPP